MKKLITILLILMGTMLANVPATACISVQSEPTTAQTAAPKIKLETKQDKLTWLGISIAAGGLLGYLIAASTFAIYIVIVGLLTILVGLIWSLFAS
jgi:hypothetical protein